MTLAIVGAAFRGNPFDLADDEAYRRWRDRKLHAAAMGAGQLVVEVRHLSAPTPAERGELLRRCRLGNMAVYAAKSADAADKGALRAFAATFGLRRLDANVLADDDGITPLHTAADGPRNRYIPYTNRAISWHTDGYYNATAAQVRGMVLHCVQPAAAGGDNAMMDPEIAYILLRDADPDLVAALTRPDAMTIPANTEEGLTRPAQAGPVFSADAATGTLHMRYTARPRNVQWAAEPVVQAAAAALAALLAADSPYIIHHRLAAGQGLLCNNVLHNRTAFAETNGRSQRLLYRARYHDRVVGTTLTDFWEQE